MAQPKLGSGARFAKLQRILAARKGKSKVSDPGALAAYIGRKSLGKARFQKLAARGRKGMK
jgi:hypothetical protein